MSDATRKAGRLAAMITLLLAVSACYEHTYTVGRGAPNGAVVYESWRHHWLGGLISPDQELELRETCPSGNATIHQEFTFLQGLLAALTSGIYYPSTVEVRCRRGSRSELEFSAAEVQRIVSDPAFLSWVQHVAPDRLEEAAAAQAELLR